MAMANPVRTISDIPIDKMGLAHYFQNYAEFLGPMRQQPLDMLELGVARGDSLKYWESWLPNARITGLDINPARPALASGCGSLSASSRTVRCWTALPPSARRRASMS